MSHLPQQVLYKLLSGHRAHLLHRTLLAGIVLKVVVPQHLLDHTLVYSLCVICYPCFRLHRQLHEQQLCTARTVRFSLQTVPLCEGTVVQQPLPLHAIQRFVNLTRFVLYRVGETKGPTCSGAILKHGWRALSGLPTPPPLSLLRQHRQLLPQFVFSDIITVIQTNAWGRLLNSFSAWS